MIRRAALFVVVSLGAENASAVEAVSLAAEADASGLSAEGGGAEGHGSDESATSGAGEPSTAPVPEAEPERVADDAAVPPMRAVAPPSYAGQRVAHRLPTGGEQNLPYLSRFLPEANLWEVGIFSGLFFPAFDHNLKVASLPAEAYNEVNLSLGARVAYFPLSFVGAEVEASVTPSATRETNKSALLYAVRAHAIAQLPMLSVVPFALVGGGALGAVSEPLGHDSDPAFHFGIGVKVPVSRIVSLRLDLRDTLTQQGRGAPSGSAAHHFEALLGATFTFERSPKTRPIPDLDYDGLYDTEDSCPDVGALTVDGCPAGADADGDGFLDGDDLCPTEAGAPGSDCPSPRPQLSAPPSEKKAAACPAGETQGPTGCVSADTDGDGLTGPAEKCPEEPETVNGFEDSDGCPDAVPAAVKEIIGVIQGISFAKGAAEVSEASYAVLDAAVSVMLAHPGIRIEVSGHTSSDGPLRANQRLSEARARAVADYLKGKGVPESQLAVRGAGPSEPIADNSTAAGREQNRRIEFRVLTQ